MTTKTSPVIRNFCYHRNGIGGRGFWAFTVTMSFECHDGEVEPEQTYLVTWVMPDEFEKKGDPGEECYFIVLTPFGPDVERTMRGDRLIGSIADELKKLYTAHRKDDDCFRKVWGFKDGKVTKEAK